MVSAVVNGVLVVFLFGVVAQVLVKNQPVSISRHGRTMSPLFVACTLAPLGGYCLVCFAQFTRYLLGGRAPSS